MARTLALLAAATLIAGCGGSGGSSGGAAAGSPLPPEIKVGAKIFFTQPEYQFPVGLYSEPTPGGADEAPAGVVEELHGRWVRLRCRPNATGKELKRVDDVVLWINFDTVLAFQAAPPG